VITPTDISAGDTPRMVSAIAWDRNENSDEAGLDLRVIDLVEANR